MIMFISLFIWVLVGIMQSINSNVPATTKFVIWLLIFVIAMYSIRDAII